MNNTQLTLNIVKYTIFGIVTLAFFLVWQIVFILQGGIGIEGNLLRILLKLIPILLYSTFSFWLILKMFDYKKKVLQKRNVSLAVGAFALVLSVIFQYFAITKKIAPFVFKNKMFSHIQPVIVSNDFRNRLILSVAQYIKLIPLGSLDSDIASYSANAAMEASFIFEFKRLLDSNTINLTCKEYINAYDDYNSCVTDFQKDIYSQYQFTSTGNVLLIAVSALGTFKAKDLMTKRYGENKLYVHVKTLNEIIETTLLSAEKSKKILLNIDRPIQFTLGYKLVPSTLIATMEQQSNYLFFITSLDKLGEIISNLEEKSLTSDKKDQNRDISSDSKLEREITKFNQLKTRLAAIQEDGFNVEEMKQKQKGMQKELEAKLSQIKQESLIFKLAALFDNSLYDFTIEKLLKDTNPKVKI